MARNTKFKSFLIIFIVVVCILLFLEWLFPDNPLSKFDKSVDEALFGLFG